MYLSFSEQVINEVDSLVLIQLVALTTTMHSIAGIIDDPVLLELAMFMHTRASSKLALQSLASLFILPAVILLRFVCLFTAN